MSRETKYIPEHMLAALIDAGAILNVYLIEDGDGLFHIVARSTKGIDHRLEKKRGGARTFKSLNAAAGLIRSMGISRMTIHMNEFASGNQSLLVERKPGKLRGQINIADDDDMVGVTKDFMNERDQPPPHK